MASLPTSRGQRSTRVRRTAVGAAALFGVLTLLLPGCGGNGGPAEPTGLNLLPDASRVQVTRSVRIEAVHLYPNAREDNPACDWYVDGVLGGNAMTGTITQANPATFTAPPAVPPGGASAITAVSREDPSFSASDTIRIAFTVRYVDGATGNDTSGGGAWTNPLRTLTYALGTVSDGDTLSVLPGTYDPAHGEAGNYFIPGGVTLVGSSRESCVIYGSGTDFSVIRLGDGATVEKVTVGNLGEDGMAILSTGEGWIRDVAVGEPFTYCCIRADGGRDRLRNNVVIADCELVNTTGSPDDDTAIELFYGTHCTVRGCTISGWEFGLHVNRDSDPRLEHNTITGNKYGVVAAGSGAPATGPDLGGGPRGSEGGNLIRDNVDVGVHNLTSAAIWALYNEWTNDPPVEGPPTPADFVNIASGTVIWTR